MNKCLLDFLVGKLLFECSTLVFMSFQKGLEKGYCLNAEKLNVSIKFKLNNLIL